jgi:hypothetical protein
MGDEKSIRKGILNYKSALNTIVFCWGVEYGK